MLHSSLAPLSEGISCELCLRSLKDCVQDVIALWATVKVDRYLEHFHDVTTYNDLY